MREGDRSIKIELGFKQSEAHILEIAPNTSVIPANGLVSHLIIYFLSIQILLEDTFWVFIHECVIGKLSKDNSNEANTYDSP